MKNFYKNKKALFAFALFGIIGIAYFKQGNNQIPVERFKSKSHQKAIIVNGVKYDGPEKMAYYHSAIRTGQEDLNAPLKYPQYKQFYKTYELEKVKEQKDLSRKVTTNATFKERGPANVPGRTRIILIDPDDVTNATWIAGNVSGGIWKTTNSGGSWKEIAPDLENQAVVTMAMAKSNSSIIYAGTGEGFLSAGTFILNGNGIYKSTDKGATWTQLSSTLTRDFINVGRIIVDPTNPDILLASTVGHKILGGSGSSVSAIMRSKDGGNSWEKVYENTNSIQQIIDAPSNFNIQYAAINSFGVVKSEDAGLTWNEVNTGLSVTDRIELAVSHSSPNKVFGSVANSSSELYVTTNGGSIWNLIPVKYNGEDVDYLGGQGWYDNTIMVNPFNDNHVYFGGVGLFEFTLGVLGTSGTTRLVADVYGALNGPNQFAFAPTRTGIHPDQHFMTPIITNASANQFKILLGNDGGIYISNAGSTPGITDGSWTWSGTGYNTTQFYGADKLAGKEEYIGGAQDNGTWVSNSEELASPSSDYNFIIGGDGFEVIAHYTDPLKVIGGSQNNGFVGFENRTTQSYNATKGLSGNGPFVSRLSNSYQDPDVLFAVESGGVYKSTDFGRNWNPSIMNDAGKWAFWSGSDVEVSKADPKIVWAGGRMTDAGSLFLSQDGGLTFDAVPNFAEIGLCSGIYSHPTDLNTAFALFSVANSPKILKTTDLGQTWADISGFSSGRTDAGFPNVATFAVQVMPYDDDIIWAGTEIGLFETLDAGETWSIKEGFPSVTIWDLKIKDGQVIIATHGRGVWTADIPELESFTIPLVTLAPRITEISSSITAQEIKLSINLRAAYNETKIYANDLEVAVLSANSVDATELVTIDISTPGAYEIQAISTKSGMDYYSSKYTVDVSAVFTPVQEYAENFEEVVDGEYLLDNFKFSQINGFSNKLLSTVHPYPVDQELIAKLNRPIIIASQNATLSFKEVVQVEEGETGTVFGDAQFWDYVIVEGTTDGVNWIPLLDGYDSGANSNWSGTSNTASETLFVNRSINLLDTFNAGDIIIIRFRLFSDVNSTAWGWGIDDLLIQANDADGDSYAESEDCDDNNPEINPGAIDIANNGIDENCDGVDNIITAYEESFNELVMYPNPVENYLHFTTPTNLKFIEVYSINGVSIQNINISNSSIDISQLKKGVYFVVFKTGDKIIRKKFIKK